ncbi:MAG: pentapeptide repeat-containing protein [Variovorax sp.]
MINTKFIKTVFAAPTLFLVAGVRCADFSQSDINNVLELGDSLREDDQRAGCRTKFQNAKMNCTFVDKWKFLDLTGADIAACADQVKPVAGQPGRDFSGGIFSQVAFDDFDLTGSKWDGALLDHARFQGATLDNATGLNGTVGNPSRLSAVKFNKASLQNVDLSNAQLYGAQFTDANLSNSSLAGSFLSANTGATPPIESAAVFDGAHLKNVNLAGAQLMGASFLYASLYGAYGGSTPAFPCQSNTSQCSVGSRTGFTCGCATASGANLTGADFSNAFLFGADFSGSGTIVNGTRFGSAILTGASFEGASFQVNGGAAPDFTKALLQGATFSTDANLGNAGLLNAFVDFGAASNTTGGNILYLQLSADYTRFKGWPASAAATPCVQTAYQSFTAVPGAVSLTCPNGNSTACGAGRPAPNPNVNWASGIAMATNTPVPGWYAIDSTYDPAPTDASLICRNSAVDPNW